MTTAPSATGRRAPTARRNFAVLTARGARAQQRTLLTWGGALGAMSALIVAIWPTIEGSIDVLLESYPASLKEAFGIRELDTAEKYYDAEMLSLIVPLALAVFAVRTATRPTVGAEERGHLDSLLSTPVSRTVLVWSAWAVAGIALAGILAVIWAITWAAGVTFGGGISAVSLGAGLVNVWPLAMAFAGFAAFVAGWMRGHGAVTAVASATLVAMYVFDLVGRISPDLELLRDVSAFRLYGSAVQDGLDPLHVLVLLAAGLALTAAGAWGFQRRDLR